MLLDVKGAIVAGDTVDFDITAAVAGDGVYCFVVDSPSDDEVIYLSSEAASGGPEVQVAIDGVCDDSAP